jgi:myo-inositol-1(or 4)-monophosphatase
LTTPIDARLRDRAQEALNVLVDAAREGAEVALRDFRWFKRTSASVRLKPGDSPVTDADLAVDRFLRARLGAAFPEAGWLSEETVDDLARLECAELIVVDPIDGTRAFLGGDPRWAVSIALVSDGRPIAGVIHAPVLGETYIAAYGCGATRDGVRLGRSSAPRRARPAAAGPRALIAAVSAASGVDCEVVPRIPSLALRLARVASGDLDLAFASGNSHDWDIAAADVVLREAGATLVGAHGGAIEYNQTRTRHATLVAWRAGLPPGFAEAALAAVREKSA